MHELVESTPLLLNATDHVPNACSGADIGFDKESRCLTIRPPRACKNAEKQSNPAMRTRQQMTQRLSAQAHICSATDCRNKSSSCLYSHNDHRIVGSRPLQGVFVKTSLGREILRQRWAVSGFECARQFFDGLGRVFCDLMGIRSSAFAYAAN